MTIIEMSRQPPARGAIERGLGWFLRLMAVVALLSGLGYWAAITGLFGDTDMRFDHAGVPARIAGTALALIMPTAALGLWLAARWGLVLWAVAVIIEIVAGAGLAVDWPNGSIAAMIDIGALLLIAVWTGAVVLERRAARSNRASRSRFINAQL